MRENYWMNELKDPLPQISLDDLITELEPLISSCNKLIEKYVQYKNCSGHEKTDEVFEKSVLTCFVAEIGIDIDMLRDQLKLVRIFNKIEARNNGES